MRPIQRSAANDPRRSHAKPRNNRFSLGALVIHCTKINTRISPLLLVCFTLPFLQGVQPAQADEAVVKMVVDYGDGVQKHFPELKWDEGLTVFDALEQASQHPRGIQFEHRGKRSTIFVYQIDDLKNEPSGRAWLFEVNGKLSDRSCGIHAVERGDTILWSFKKYR